jgi:hypothetical protein
MRNEKRQEGNARIRKKANVKYNIQGWGKGFELWGRAALANLGWEGKQARVSETLSWLELFVRDRRRTECEVTRVLCGKEERTKTKESKTRW